MKTITMVINDENESEIPHIMVHMRIMMNKDFPKIKYELDDKNK